MPRSSGQQRRRARYSEGEDSSLLAAWFQNWPREYAAFVEQMWSEISNARDRRRRLCGPTRGRLSS